MAYSPSSPVFARSAISRAAFTAILTRAGSPAAPEAPEIYAALTGVGIDPAVALGQVAAESTYGTRGYAVRTRNWGNITIRRPALPHWTRLYGGRPWRAPNGRTYAAFPSWTAGVRAYAALLRSYRLGGWAGSIARMSSRWLGMRDATRSGYVRTIVAHAGRVPLAPPTPAPVPVPPLPPRAPRPPPIALVPTHVALQVPEFRYGFKAELLALGVGRAWLAYSADFPSYRTVTEPLPVFVLVHGGPQPLGSFAGMDGLAGWLAAAGALAIAIDYRPDSAVADITATLGPIAELAPRYGGDPSRLVLVAHSFGGYPAAAVAFAEELVDGYVAIAAINSRAGIGPGVADFGDPIELAVRRSELPVAVVAGSADPVAPADDDAGFLAALERAGHPGLNVVVDGADHDAVLLSRAAVETCLATAALAG